MLACGSEENTFGGVLTANTFFIGVYLKSFRTKTGMKANDGVVN